jgi:HEPN domain-containing protein
VPGLDPTHWLHRLTAPEWLAAAETELAQAAEALGRRAFRPGVTHARRAAGMAWNAVLAAETDETRAAELLARYGRSYMEHVVALTSDRDVPDDIRAAAQLLRDTPPAPPELVTLGKPDLRVLDAARTITAHARGKVAP